MSDPQPPTRVLVVAKGFPPDLGGIETYSYEVSRAYAQLGCAVHVLTSHQVERAADPDGFAWFESVRQTRQSATALRLLASLAKLRARGYAPDLIHATSWRVAGLARMVWPGARLAVTVHGREVFDVSRSVRTLAANVLRAADQLVFVSSPIREKFVAAYPSFHGRKRMLVAWNGCTDWPPGLRNPAREAGTIFTVCRLVERKNVRSAIAAVARLRDRGIAFRYRVAGAGPDAAHLQQQIADLELEPHVEMLGRVPDDDLAAEYSRAAIFLHPQIAAADGADVEGFGIAIADAMRFGAVPIAGDNGGPRDFIATGENGYLVDGLDIDELAGCLERLLTDDALRERLASRASEFAHRNFSWRSHVTAILDACIEPSVRPSPAFAVE